MPMSKARINRSGRTRQAYFIMVLGLIIFVAVIQMPVGGAAAGVQMARWEQINNRHMTPVVLIPTSVAKL